MSARGDVVSRYQRWLGNADVYSGVESLGVPIAAKAGGLNGGNVHALRPTRFQAAQESLRVAYEDAVRREKEGMAG
jgi:hypothetical protein